MCELTIGIKALAIDGQNDIAGFQGIAACT